MARQQVNNVEYFPHYAKPGKTLFILEGKYGNDGYAFWFKILELLASSENHYYDCSSDADWQYFIARTKISDQSATEILDLLAKLGNIDADLWKTSRIIWCEAFVNNLTEVYRKRKRELPKKPPCFIPATVTPITATETQEELDQSATEMPQSKVKESKEKKSKALLTQLGDNNPPPSDEQKPEAFSEKQKKEKALLDNLNDLMKRASITFTNPWDQRTVLVFIQANIHCHNPDAIQHCVESAIRNAKEIKDLAKWLNAALLTHKGGEDANYNARDSENQCNAFKADQNPLSALAGIVKSMPAAAM